MSHPRSQAAQAALSNAFARAVDLSALQQRPGTSGATGSASAAGASSGSTSTSPFVIDATDATFQEVLQASTQVPVVVDLWATWCEPCKQLSPVLERLAEESNGSWILAKVDVDANPAIAQAFQVQSIPTVVAIAGGRPVAAFSGAQPEPQVREWLKQLLDQLREVLPGIKQAEADAPAPEPEPEDPRLTAAQDATERGDFGAARAAYQAILDAEPGHVEAAAGLAWSELFERAAAVSESAGQDAIARSDSDPADVAAAIDAADLEVAGGASAAGFARLVAAVQRTADDERARAREHLLTLFALFAADDPDVVTARRALAAALY